jgi:hypothetical protein
MKTVGNTKIVNIMKTEARGAPIAFLKDITNPYKGLSIRGESRLTVTLIPFFYFFAGGVGLGVMRMRMVAPTSRTITTNQAGV